MPVRLKDIAEELGVSIVTVSKAIKGHPDLPEKTRQRILQRAEELNYTPNLMARSLVTGRSSLVAMLVPDLIHPFFAEIAKVFSTELHKKGYFLILASSNCESELEKAEIQHLLTQRLGAMVIASIEGEPQTLQKVLNHDVPLVLLDQFVPKVDCDFLGTNDVMAGEIATEHLISLGHTRIAHLRGPDNYVANDRCKGFLAAMKRHRLPVPIEYVVAASHYTPGRETGELAFKEVIRASPRPTAVFCFNDTIAIGALSVALDLGINVPGDLSIVGCGNYHFSDSIAVPLTSVDQNTSELGRRLSRIVLSNLISKGKQRSKRHRVTPTLCLRKSSGKCLTFSKEPLRLSIRARES